MELKFKWKFNIKDLPDMGTLNHEIDGIAKNVTIGRTLFMEKFGVSSEREYKERMMKEKKVMKHSAVGLNSWQAQEEGLEKIYDELTKSGSYRPLWRLSGLGHGRAGRTSQQDTAGIRADFEKRG